MAELMGKPQPKKPPRPPPGPQSAAIKSSSPEKRSRGSASASHRPASASASTALRPPIPHTDRPPLHRLSPQTIILAAADMSREAYTAPNLAAGGSQQQQQQGANTGNTGFQMTSQSNFEDGNRPVAYLCGDCDNKVTLKRGDPIRCKECGYRVLYKQRTNR
ncbi:hypothetical protein MBLNU459_g6962t1 [Dothideomycetes sp. NU459]